MSEKDFKDLSKEEKLQELSALMSFHRDGLAQYSQVISPSSQYLIQRTIKALEELSRRISS